MELKVDVSRSRCRAFWDRSRLERALETLGAWRTLYGARAIWPCERERYSGTAVPRARFP